MSKDPWSTEAHSFYMGEPANVTYKATEQYLDHEDVDKVEPALRLLTIARTYNTPERVPVLDLLKALEDLRNHLRGKYYAG